MLEGRIVDYTTRLLPLAQSAPARPSPSPDRSAGFAGPGAA